MPCGWCLCIRMYISDDDDTHVLDNTPAHNVFYIKQEVHTPHTDTYKAN